MNIVRRGFFIGTGVVSIALASGFCEAKSQYMPALLVDSDYQYGERFSATEWIEVAKPDVDPECFSFKYRILRGADALDVEVMVPDRIVNSNDLVSVSVNGCPTFAGNPFGAIPDEGLGKGWGVTPDIVGTIGEQGKPWLVRYKFRCQYAFANIVATSNADKSFSVKVKIAVHDDDRKSKDELVTEVETVLPAWKPLVLDVPYAGAASKVKPAHVVFLGADGLNSWHMDRIKLPFIRSRMAEGAWSREARAVLVSGSGMNWSSIFTCAPVEYHGHWTNDKRPVIEPYVKDENGFFPSIFSAMRHQQPTERTFFCSGWLADRMGVNTRDCTFAGSLGYLRGVVCLIDPMLPKIKPVMPRFAAFINGQPDMTGHGVGHGTKEYIAMCERVDADLARTYRAFLDAGITPENSVFVFTSDHGGLGRGHGGIMPQEMNRPLVIWGKGVKRNYRIENPGNSCDTGATLAALLGITPLRCWIGKPIDEAFEALD